MVQLLCGKMLLRLNGNLSDENVFACVGLNGVGKDPAGCVE